MATVETYALWLHVAAGVVALVAGLGALVTAKGGGRHRRAGRVYVSAMGVVVLTVPVLFAFEPGFLRGFLVLVATFSGYLVFSGYRTMRGRPVGGARPVDWAGAVVVVAACLGLGVWGVSLLAAGTGMGAVLTVFGGIGLAMGAADLRAFRAGDTRDGPVVDHLTRMVAGYIATVTAVAVVNLAGTPVPAVVAWLGPTALGVPLILYWQAKYADVGPLSGVV